jgi:tetratricopeptide (TPR) repeat protein
LESEKKALDEFFAKMSDNSSGNSGPNKNTIFEESSGSSKSDTKLESSRKRALAESEKNKGNECMKAKEYPEAIEHYQKAVSLDPSHFMVYGNLAQAYLNLKSKVGISKNIRMPFRAATRPLQSIILSAKAITEEPRLTWLQATTSKPLVISLAS